MGNMVASNQNVGGVTNGTRYQIWSTLFDITDNQGAIQRRMNVALTFKNIRVVLLTAPGGGASYTVELIESGGFVIWLGGGDLVITDPATEATHTADTLVATASDLVSLRWSPAGAPVDTDVRVIYELEHPTAGWFCTFGGNNNANGSSPVWFNACGGDDAVGGTDLNAKIPVPFACALEEMYLHQNPAPGAGNTYRYELWKNGATTGHTFDIAETATVGSLTGIGESFAEGDEFSIRRIDQAGTPADAAAESITFVWSTAQGNRFFTGGLHKDNHWGGATGTQYQNPGTTRRPWSATEGDNQSLGYPPGGGPAVRWFNLTASLDNDPAGTFTLSTRKNGVTVAGSGLALVDDTVLHDGAAVGATADDAADLIGLQVVEVGGSTTDPRYSLAAEYLPVEELLMMGRAS